MSATNKKVGALLLAAGFSNRFGSAKLLARLDSGNSVFSQTFSRLSSVVPDIKVVTRPELTDELKLQNVDLIVFPDAQRGMGASLAFGMQQVPHQWDACLICLADMPFIKPATYQTLVNSAQADRIVVPVFEDKPGNPVVFGRQFFAQLQSLSGDAGGKPVLKQHREKVVRLTVDDPAVLSDIDTPKDLEELQSTFA